MLFSTAAGAQPRVALHSRPLPAGVEVAPTPDLPMVIAANDGQIAEYRDMNGGGRQLLLGTAYNATVGSLVLDPFAALTVTRGGAVLRQNVAKGAWEPTTSSPYITAVAYDAEGRMLGVGCTAGMVVRIERSGAVTRLGSKGTGARQFQCPEGIAVDNAGHIFVADMNRIVRMDDMEGHGWTTYGTRGSGTGQFVWAHALAFDRRGRLHVGDKGNHRVVRVDDMNGAGWVALDASRLGLSDVYGVTVDFYGRVYATDATTGSVARVNDMTGAGLKRLRVAPISGPAAILVRAPAGGAAIR